MDNQPLPQDKIEYSAEEVSATDHPYGYDPSRDKAKLKAMQLTMDERIGLALVSAFMATGLPIVVGMLWASLIANSVQPELAFGGNAINSLVLFLILIFAIPLTTIFSWVSGYVAFKKSKKAGRAIAIGSFVISAVGLIMLVLFINSLNSLSVTPAA